MRIYKLTHITETVELRLGKNILSQEEFVLVNNWIKDNTYGQLSCIHAEDGSIEINDLPDCIIMDKPVSVWYDVENCCISITKWTDNPVIKEVIK